jgi:glyoxylase-like metal-dependent hydrolase (beta-lactamase superfamily II)
VQVLRPLSRSLSRLLTPTPHQGGDLRLHAVARDVFLYRGYFSNSAVLLLPRSVLVVDTQVTPRAAQPLLAQLRALTDRPVRMVFNTHHHGDHVGGNAAFAGAEIIASGHTARFMVERADERLEYARTFGLEVEDVPPPVPPARTFDERLDLVVDGERLQLFRAGPVETPDAAVLWWPARRVLATGDAVATAGYPYLGVPFLDEGLRDDGGWVGHLARLRALAPRVVLPGHGPALVGRRRIGERLDLLSALMRDLLAATRAELALTAGGVVELAARIERRLPSAARDLEDLVARIDRRLARYARRRDLEQSVATQRFAIYRALNSCLPGRQGRGWWHDLRPSALAVASTAEAEVELAGWSAPDAVPDTRLKELADLGRRDLAIAAMALWLERHPTAGSAAAYGLLSELYFDGAAELPSKIDASEYIRGAARAAKTALALDPEAPLALLNLGTIEILSALIAGQDPARGAARIETALASSALDRRQRRRGRFALAKAHQAAFRPAEADRQLRKLLPVWARPFFPLLRTRLRSLP